MNPCDRPTSHKRQIAVALMKSSTGLSFRIELITVADLVHLFALSMGYKPEIAFAFGVISRSVPEVQAGEGDVDVATAHKAIKIAEMLSRCRQEDSLPEDAAQANALIMASAHVHNFEAAYAEMISRAPELEGHFLEQYNDWLSQQDKKERKRLPSPTKRIFASLKRWIGGVKR